MAFSIPSIGEIGTRLKNSFRAYLPGTDAWIEPNNLSVTSRTFALTMFEAYQRLQFLYRQLFASTADAYHLEFRHGYEYGITRKASQAASGFVIISQVTPTANVVIPAGLRVLRGDNVSYITTQAGVMASGAVTVPVRCETSGASTDTPDGVQFALEQQPSLPNLSDTVVVAAGGIGGGADAETDDQLRSRILYRKRNPPHGGSLADYVIWATSIPGCTRCYVSPFTNSPSAVTLYPLFDDTRVNGIPTDADLAAVRDYIGASGTDGVRPVTARIYVVAAIPTVVPITISNLSNDTSATRQAIAVQLAAMFVERIVVSTPNSPFVLPISWISEAISRATNENRHTLVSPPSDVSIAAGHLPVLGSISFV
ncbi:MAG: Baseplate family protein [Hyphomicrobiales bacterium]|nr:Baseplate family protein [Hyphomicrobiales bacterium]